MHSLVFNESKELFTSSSKTVIYCTSTAVVKTVLTRTVQQIQSYQTIKQHEIHENINKYPQYLLLKALCVHYNENPLIGRLSSTVIYVPKEHNRNPEI